LAAGLVLIIGRLAVRAGLSKEVCNELWRSSAQARLV